MKILYAVQATGNGHISRAMELLPYLRNYGTVDIFLSGDNSSLTLDAPVKFRSKGLSLYYNNGGGLNYVQMMAQTKLLRCVREAKQLPVENYQMVINDFEAITAMACSFKKVPSVQFGHQASFQSAATPRPAAKSKMGEWILKNYAKADRYVGLHFKSFDSFIYTPVIREELRKVEPLNKGHITVYLPAYPSSVLLPLLHRVNGVKFELFSKDVRFPSSSKNVVLMPVQKNSFATSMLNSDGVIAGAGFETPAEALYLRKKLLAIPIKGHYEQLCNAAALEQIGVKVIKRVDDAFPVHISSWMNEKNTIEVDYSMQSEKLVNALF